MDQDEGAGHHAITRRAVQELFASGRADANGRINGMTQEAYYRALDERQEYQDRPWGPTIDPGWLNPGAQREHGMADPFRSGEENRVINRDYVEGELRAARDGNEMAHLGNAAHALEDSYSEAHAFRGQSVNDGDPTAPIESFNVFDPLPNPRMGTWGKISNEQGTHDERFDEVPVGADGNLVGGSDIAAAHALAQMLEAYEDNRGQPDAVAHRAMDSVVDRFYQAEWGGTTVNREASDAWRAERDRRLAQDRDEVGAAALTPLDQDHDLDGGALQSRDKLWSDPDDVLAESNDAPKASALLDADRDDVLATQDGDEPSKLYTDPDDVWARDHGGGSSAPYRDQDDVLDQPDGAALQSLPEPEVLQSIGDGPGADDAPMSSSD